MKRLSKSHIAFAGLAMIFTAGLAGPASATDYFVNNTGAPVTDFHFDQVTLLLPREPKSVPWGEGTLTGLGDGKFRMSYSGTAIPVGGKLKFKPGTFTDDASHEFSNFVWTPGGQDASLQRDSSALPEPSVWLTMVMGFGAMGGMFRQRRGTSAAGALKA